MPIAYQDMCHALTTHKADLPTFNSVLDEAIQSYQRMLNDASDASADEKIMAAITQVAAMKIGVHAFDAVKAFHDRREDYPKVQLIVAEDNEAVIKSMAKGRSAKMRHVARTHRVNFDWLYEIFRHPEIRARYVGTKYQIADLGTKAICHGETWQRLTAMMGIKPASAAKVVETRAGNRRTRTGSRYSPHRD